MSLLSIFPSLDGGVRVPDHSRVCLTISERLVHSNVLCIGSLRALGSYSLSKVPEVSATSAQVLYSEWATPFLTLAAFS
jgi:hypothetical protein